MYEPKTDKAVMTCWISRPLWLQKTIGVLKGPFLSINLLASIACTINALSASRFNAVIMKVNRSEVLSGSKLELMKSPYLESMSTSNISLHSRASRIPGLGSELYQVISQRKRAQTVVKDLERKVAAHSQQPSKPLPKAENFPRRLSSDRQAELLYDLKLKIRQQTEARKLQREEQRDLLLQQKRVFATQREVLQMKEKLLEDRKMSPAERLLLREIEPRFSTEAVKKEPKRKRNNSKIYLYADLLQREKQTLTQLKDKASAR